MEKKDKYELPKIKMSFKRKNLKSIARKILEQENSKNNQINKKEINKENENKENMNKENGKKENRKKRNIEIINMKNEIIIKEEKIKNNKEKQELLKPYTNKYNKESTKIFHVNNNNKIEEEEEKEEVNSKEKEKREKIEKREEKIDESSTKVISIEENKKENNNDESNIKSETDTITDSLEKFHLEELRNYIGIVTNETIFEYLVSNYYSNEMKEFNLTLNELLILGDVPFLKKLNNGKDMKEKVYQTFNNYLFNNSVDIIPIFNKKKIEGFIYPKDFFYYIYNCESKQSLTNEEFLINLYKDIDEEKPYGKNRIIYLELNDKTKAYYVKELIEKLNCSIEKKIVIYDPNDNNIIYLISLKTIFRAIVDFQLSNK